MQSKAAKQETVKAQEWCLATMMHRVKTPITVLKSAIELIACQKSDADPVLRKLLDVMSSSVQEIEDLIDQDLAVLKQEAENWETSCHSIDLVEIVRDILESFRSEYEVRFLAPTVIPPVWCDPFALKSVLHQLLENAFQYGEGLVTVTLLLKGSFELEGRVVGVRLANDVDDSVHLTDDIFVLGDRGVIELGEGTGIGLYVARAYARSMGGEVTLEQTGNCVVFTVWLRENMTGA